MEADSDPASDNRTDSRPDHQPVNSQDAAEEIGSVPFDRMVWPRPAPDATPENLPEIPPHQQVWLYDQPAQGKRGKNRRYTGHVQRIGGSAGEKIRAELAAVIRDLLEWAHEQQTDALSEKESREDGAADDIAE